VSVNHAIRQGASGVDTVAGPAHYPLDRAVPRAGHRMAYAPFESTVTEVRDPAAFARVGVPDARVFDPLPAPPTRPARYPIVATVRRGAFTDQPLLGNRLPLLRAAAAAAPLQSMEPSPTARRNTFRITPKRWDEQLNEANTGGNP